MFKNIYLYYLFGWYCTGDANADSVTGGGLWFGKNLTDAVDRGDVTEERVIIFIIIIIDIIHNKRIQ